MFRSLAGYLGPAVLTMAFCARGGVAVGDDDARAREQFVAQGRALFEREWTPGARRMGGGDGLGPVYNDTSCVACHNLGAVGGGGPRSKNVHLVDSTLTPVTDVRCTRALRRRLQSDSARRQGKTLPPPRGDVEPVDRQPLIKLHAGFRNAASVPVPRYGPEADYETWRLGLLAPDARIITFGNSEVALHQAAVSRLTISVPYEYGHFTLTVSERNPPPLFGAGPIDAISDQVLEEAETIAYINHPEIRGRVSRLPDGRIGRFGWKAQAATLDDFVLTACAEELGLEVPGHPQAENPRAPNQTAPGLDLTRAECNALTAFVASLPAPAERAAPTRDERALVKFGTSAFDRVGCATCHRPTLGPVNGIYSDLLLHDMGNQLGASGGYSFFNSSPGNETETLPGSTPNGPMAFDGAVDRPKVSASTRARQWRTAPLWGVRDSAPYLHDGRAETLEQAIALHGGEASRIAERYFAQPSEARRAIERFLKSLTAPELNDRTDAAREVPDFAVPPPARG